MKQFCIIQTDSGTYAFYWPAEMQEEEYWKIEHDLNSSLAKFIGDDDLPDFGEDQANLVMDKYEINRPFNSVNF